MRSLLHLIAVCWLLSGPVSQVLAQSAPLTPEQQTKLKERDQLRAQALARALDGKAAEAVAVLVKVLAIERALLPPTHEDIFASVDLLGYLHEALNDLPESRKLRQQLLEQYRQKFGPDHWQTADAQRALADLERRVQMTAAQQQQLLQARFLNEQGRQFNMQGKYALALQAWQQVFTVRKALLGEQHPDYAGIMNNLAFAHQNQGALDRAEPLHRQALAIRQRALGEQHPLYAQSLQNLAALHVLKGQYDQAEPLFRQALAIRKQALGAQHPIYAMTVDSLAGLYGSQGRHERAEPLYREALAIRKQTLGEKHPGYASSLLSLAALHYAQGAYDRAEPLYRQAQDIFKQAFGENNTYYANSLHGLALVYRAQGAFDRAEPLYRQALAIQKQALGEKHPDYAKLLHNLASHYNGQGVYDKAEQLYLQVLAIRKQTLGEKHPFYAQTLYSLAQTYISQRAYERAEPLLREALAIRKEVLGEKHPQYAWSLYSLGWVYHNQGASERAEPLLREALAIRKQVLGEKHPDTTYSLIALAILHHSRGEYEPAAALCRQAAAIRKEVQGEKHPDYAFSLYCLAGMHRAQKDHERAAAFYRQAMQLVLAHQEQSALAQTELDQLSHGRSKEIYLSNYLASSLRANLPAEQVYALVLPWKGSVTARQQLTRFARTALEHSEAETLQLFQRLETVARQLARLSLDTPDPRKQAERAALLQQLGEEHEQLEKTLVRKTEAYRKLHQSRQLTAAQLQQALPPDAALVDYVIYRKWADDDKASTLQLVAFVVRRERIERVELQELTAVDDAVRRFVASVRKRQAPVMGKDDPAELLRDRLWLPLAKQLEGAKLVLIAPTGSLCSLPWAALPTAKGDKYLLEEQAIAVVPVPQLLPQLLEPRQGLPAPPSLLVVGDVDFDARGTMVAKSGTTPAWERQRAGEALQWDRLPGTRAELLAIADTFRKTLPKGQLTSLREGEATEAKLAQLAGQHEHLHLATHGFFAPEKYRSVLQGDDARHALADIEKQTPVVGHHPGLLSGLVLAGANQPRAEGDDEVLTALEVAHMDLSRVKLAVLSACETGLGKVAGGEGVLGLQRAFQVAGARSTVTSYWKVDDDATRRLMERFYENYWQKGQGTLEALREAQLWMLREGRTDPAVQRGVERVQVPASPKDGRLPPYYWAAFVLSGDWR